MKFLSWNSGAYGPIDGAFSTRLILFARISGNCLSSPSAVVYLFILKRPITYTIVPFLILLKSGIPRPFHATTECHVVSSFNVPLLSLNVSFVAILNLTTVLFPTVVTLASCPTFPLNSILFIDLSITLILNSLVLRNTHESILYARIPLQRNTKVLTLTYIKTAISD